ncbi:histidinol-phosphate transaminase [Planctomicrobium sp. SH664]|uniref:histidinol-phosphate transaminase n=1 Tax=Planctomicrobium sp. SH664 TaxID=3448125 RepID=UPI003F5BBA8C
MSLFRPNIDKLHGYVPGEQPQESGWVKLNTNENPYPPSPRVFEAIDKVARERLHIYPDPVGKSFCRAAGEVLGVDPSWIFPTNGSDEALTILVRAFTDTKDLIAYPYPSYILYESLAEIQGTRHARLQLNPDWSWNLQRNGPLLEQAKLLFVPNPNSPSGTRWDDKTLLSLVPSQGILVLDEAYGDFARQPHQLELLKTPEAEQIVVTRTLSKSYSLAGLRFGFVIAHPQIIHGLRKVKDSYNCDALSLAAAEAAIRDQDWMLANRARILATRERLSERLTQYRFSVLPSEANFVWVQHPSGRHEELHQQLKARKVLVRYMKFPGAIDATPQNLNGLIDGLRISVGTDAQIDQFLTSLQDSLSALSLGE